MSVTWHTVRRWFTAVDIATMRELGHPLDDYDYVARNATVLLKRIADESMPPAPFKMWPPNRIDDFREWIANGCPYQQDESKISQDVLDFTGFSEAFTGFDNLSEDYEQAAKNLKSIRDWTTAYSYQMIKPRAKEYGNLVEVLHAILTRWRQIERDAPEEKRQREEHIQKRLTEFAKEKLKDKSRHDFVGVVKANILLWYTGSLPTNDPLSTRPLSVNQWADGLMWRAAQAHPPGFSTEGLDYWVKAPENGKNTGLGDTATHFKTKKA